MTRLLQRSQQHHPTGPTRRAGRRDRWVTALSTLLLVLAGPFTLEAQFFPSTVPDEVFRDDFEVDSISAGLYRVYQEPAGGWAPNWWVQDNLGTVDDAKGGVWGNQMVRETQTTSGRWSVLAIEQSRPGNPGYLPSEWSNNRIEIGISPVDSEQTGIAFGLHDDDADGALDRGYILYFDSFPSEADALAGDRARWHLVKYIAPTWTELGRGEVELDPGASAAAGRTMVAGGERVYRVRLEFFCGNLRVQVQRITNRSGQPLLFHGCGAGCPSASPDCWCPVMEWLETGVSLAPGMVGVYAGGNDPAAVNHRWDNLAVASWGESCHQVCSEWSSWSDDWDPLAPGAEGRQALEFKLLYEGALLDLSYGRPAPGYQIDLDVQRPAPDGTTVSCTPGGTATPSTTGFCNGWSLLVDLPPPAAPSNFDEVRALLEPMSTAVDLVNDGGALSWQDSFDPDPASPTYDPIPILTRGSTPIAASLLDAYNWYQDSITTGLWSNDPLAECRLWYVVLITDGEESCCDNACDPDQAAWKFKLPDIGEPVRVFTIGFSEEFDPLNPSPLQCVSQITDGEFFAAPNASDLADALYEVINRMDERDRSFVPFKISPPPSTAGTSGNVRDYLALFPLFVPQQEESLWTGNLYAFKLNVANPDLPVTGDCQIDLSQVEWDAAGSLTTQLGLGTPLRDVYIGMETVSGWTRHRLEDVGTNATLRADFKSRLRLPALPSDLEAQEIANFMRNIWANPMGLDPPPQLPPRPFGYSVLGDIYHSQPVTVNPPNTPQFFYDYGFVQPGETGAHDYQLFMQEHAKRRRVALAGANDGMIHAFDAGFHDRDDGGLYDDQHDLGTGTELFAHVPDAVLDKVWVMTYGTEQQYLVDGHIATGDVFISPDGGTSPKEWRTVALATMRRGGRGVVALDITQPDPTTGSPDYTPTETVMPGCASGTAGNCSAEYPRLMWEFSDTSDDDGNCPLGLSGDDCAPYWDLGWTWSKPVIARIAVYNGGTPSNPNDTFVAFFGGGWDRNESDWTGNFVYGVDIETGAVVYKQPIGVSVPGSFSVLDSDYDGFDDRIYFGDSDGSLWRIGYPAPDNAASTGVSAGTLTRLYDFRADFGARQQFFVRPVIVPASFDGANFTWAITLGAGDRANLQLENGDVSGYFFVLDAGDTTTRTAADLLALDYSTLSGDFTCATNALDPANGLYGWYMTMRPNERVTFESSVIAGHVLFATFEPGDDLLASDPPDLCPGGGGGGGGGGGADPGDPDQPICGAAGIGRVYDLWFQCGNGTTTEFNDFMSGQSVFNGGGQTRVTFTPDTPKQGYTLDFTNPAAYTVTNWRQE